MKHDVLRQLGYKDHALDETLSLLIDQTIEKVQKLKGVFDMLEVDMGHLNLEGRSIERFLNGCKRVIIFAASLGTEADRMLLRAGHKSQTEQLILNAVLNVHLEELLDGHMKDIEGTPRFSPGYGDFDMSHNLQLLDHLNKKKLGITVSEVYTLTPTKSVIGVVGLGKKTSYHPCDDCLKRSTCDMKICRRTYEE